MLVSARTMKGVPPSTFLTVPIELTCSFRFPTRLITWWELKVAVLISVWNTLGVSAFSASFVMVFPMPRLVLGAWWLPT